MLGDPNFWYGVGAGGAITFLMTCLYWLFEILSASRKKKNVGDGESLTRYKRSKRVPKSQVNQEEGRIRRYPDLDKLPTHHVHESHVHDED